MKDPKAQEKDIELWAVWNLINKPVLLIYGENSDIMKENIVQKMQETGPKAKTFKVSECGHAPQLMQDNEINAILEFIEN